MVCQQRLSGCLWRKVTAVFEPQARHWSLFAQSGAVAAATKPKKNQNQATRGSKRISIPA
jgi:hypothetical protein